MPCRTPVHIIINLPARGGVLRAVYRPEPRPHCVPRTAAVLRWHLNLSPPSPTREPGCNFNTHIHTYTHTYILFKHCSGNLFSEFLMRFYLWMLLWKTLKRFRILYPIDISKKMRGHYLITHYILPPPMIAVYWFWIWKYQLENAVRGTRWQVWK